MKLSLPCGVAALLAASASLACGGHDFEPPDRAARVAEAESLFVAAVFDTITWETDAARLEAGNAIFAEECRRCHGPLGRGSTAYAAQHELDVPSLVEPDWELADDPVGVRRRIFTGHPDGMPTWGVGRLAVRDIDAVASYVLERLRPEVLGDSVPAVLR